MQFLKHKLVNDNKQLNMQKTKHFSATNLITLTYNLLIIFFPIMKIPNAVYTENQWYAIRAGTHL